MGFREGHEALQQAFDTGRGTVATVTDAYGVLGYPGSEYAFSGRPDNPLQDRVGNKLERASRVEVKHQMGRLSVAVVGRAIALGRDEENAGRWDSYGDDYLGHPGDLDWMPPPDNFVRQRALLNTYRDNYPGHPGDTRRMPQPDFLLQQMIRWKDDEGRPASTVLIATMDAIDAQYKHSLAYRLLVQRPGMYGVEGYPYAENAERYRACISDSTAIADKLPEVLAHLSEPERVSRNGQHYHPVVIRDQSPEQFDAFVTWLLDSEQPPA